MPSRIHRPASLLSLTLLAGACGGAGDDTAAAGPQPLDLPDDPAQAGVPVGVRTVVVDDLTLEVWYPADDAHRGQAGDPVVLDEFVPQNFVDHVGPVALPALPSSAVRDAAVRPLEAPVPVVLFSHGFGGFRSQSVFLTSHLASRGYVVVAPDHPGRMLGDVLPCLFAEPLDGCDLSGFVDDPGPDGLDGALAWLDGGPGWMAGRVDLDRVAVLGHSAGAGSATTWADRSDRVDAVLPMAGGSAVASAPALYLGGTCDPYPGIQAIEASWTAATDGQLVSLLGAGHLAFTDLCTLDLAGLAEEVLADRDDLSAIYYDQLLALGTDGCPGRTPDPELVGAECTEYLPLEESASILRHYVTAFLDHELSGTGPGVQPGVHASAEVGGP